MAGSREACVEPDSVPRGFALRSPLVWLGVAFTCGFGYLAIKDIPLGDTWAALGSSTYWWLLAAFPLFAVAIFLRVLRWRALFDPDTRPPLGAAAHALLVGYFLNSVLPLRAGEVGRVVALRRAAQTSRGETAATIVVERIYDVASLVVLLFATLVWLPDIGWIRPAIALAVGLTVAVGAAVLVLRRWRERTVEFGFALVELIPYAPTEQLRRAVDGAARGAAALISGANAGPALVWTFASWAVMAMSFWLVMLCFDLGVPPLAGLLVLIATSLSLILPSSPGAIGVFEAAVLVALNAYGVPRAEALSYALVLHAMNFFPFILAGAFVLKAGPDLRRNLRRP